MAKTSRQLQIENKDLQKQIDALIIEKEKLIKEVENQKSYYSRAHNECNDLKHEIESVHTALDCMMVPRLVKLNTYSEKTMTIASRLFAWQSGARVKESKMEVE